jgi:putative restriction endonuclease
MQLEALGLLERGELRKAAIDCGFDIVQEEPAWVAAASTHAPLKVWLGRVPRGLVVGLSMAAVRAELHTGTEVAVAPPAPAVACWLVFDSVATLDAALMHAWELSRALPNELERQFQQRVAAVSATERDATVKQRIGQNLFRDGLMVLWEGRCAISGLDEPSLLRASHALPWAQASDAERLDVFNGLLLAAHLDAAFDAGLLAIDEDGAVLLSPKLTKATSEVLAVRPGARVRLSAGHVRYLTWHRLNRFKR